LASGIPDWRNFEEILTEPSACFQYFINYNLENGWYLTSTPVITANWEASGGTSGRCPSGAA